VCSLSKRHRVLLIAPHGSYRTAPYIDAALNLDIELLIASEGRDSIVSAYAQGLHIDFQDPVRALNMIINEAKTAEFSGVIATDDSTIELASRVCEKLNLAYNSPSAARIARRKDLARQCLLAQDVPVPEFRVLDLDEPLSEQIAGVLYPCVAKPLAMSASRGVIRADNPQQLLQAIRRIEPILAAETERDERRQLLVETFIPGVEIALDGLLDQGNLQILAIFDKPEPLNGPFFEESYYISPSRLNDAQQAEICRQVELACRAFGLRDGPVHAECRINSKAVWILEIAARTIGGLCSRLFQFGSGYSLEQLVFSHAIGQSVQSSEGSVAAGVLMIPIPRAGILRRVEGTSAASRVEYVEEVIIQIREGYQLVPLPEGASYLGFIFASAPTAELVEIALRKAHEELTVVTAPVWKMGAG